MGEVKYGGNVRKLSLETIQNFQSILNTLVIGENYWFLSSTQENFRHLFLSSTTSDPAGEKILLLASGIQPELENITAGFATYTGSGALRFASETDDPSFISDLIFAVHNQGAEYFFLNNLVGSEFVYRSKEGTSIYNEDEKWAATLKYDNMTLGDALGAAAPGERFWASYQEEEVDFPLVLVPLASDPTQIHFRKAIQSNAVNGELPPIGIAEWSGTQLDIFLSRPSKNIMKSLFVWLRKTIQTNPKLSRLHGAQIYRLQTDGSIRPAPMKMEAWEKLKVSHKKHQMHSLIDASLSNVTANDKFWMLYDMENNLLVLSSVVLDPDKRNLMQSWQDVSIGIDATPSPGLALITSKLGLIMMTADKVSSFRQMLIEIAHNASAYPSAQQLILASVQPLLNEATGAGPIESTVDKEFVPIHTALSSVEVSKEYWFWFAEKTKDNSPILALFDATDDPQHEQLKNWKEKAPKAKKVVIGKGAYKKDGFVFKGRSPSPQFLSILSSWVVENSSKCPSLSVLNNTVFIYKDKDSGERHVQKDASLWS